MNVESIKKELERLTMEELQAVKHIFEFNLRGILIGNRFETAQKLDLVNQELEFRSVEN